jgi:MinD superfamily P-loop ATPase
MTALRELTVISGKGGTGKTTLTAAFASLAQNAVMADCDVDAADLHLILDPKVKERIPFHGLQLAVRDEGLCNQCGECEDHCRFGAVDSNYSIIEERCEGCGVCELICPTEAISLVDRVSGTAYLSETRFGPMAHAELHTAEEASGKLVTLVRNLAKKLAKVNGRDIILIDGPPGIGCPVIAAISGVNMVLVVTEPTVSGVHDLERVLGVADHFKVKAAVCVNKADINMDMTRIIQGFCSKRGVEVIGLIPYDNVATEAMIAGKTLIEHGEGVLSAEVRKIWSKVVGMVCG